MTTYKVLYIEDNEANLQLVEIILARRSELIMLKAITGYEGIEIAEKEKPNVILLDLSLPDINGRDVLKILKGGAETSNIPVIALSGDMLSGSATSEQNDFDATLGKPVDIA